MFLAFKFPAKKLLKIDKVKRPQPSFYDFYCSVNIKIFSSQNLRRILLYNSIIQINLNSAKDLELSFFKERDSENIVKNKHS